MSGALRAALEATGAAMPDEPTERQLLVAAKVRALMVGYDQRWLPSPDTPIEERWVAVELERTVRMPLINPETSRASRTWQHGGKRDGIVEGFGQRVLLEHKTTSENIKDPNDPYWRILMIDSQVSHYSLEAWQEGQKLDGTLYDVIRKPSIRPKNLDRKSISELMTRQSYLGVALDTFLSADQISGLLADVAAGVVRRETPELYAVRLSIDTIENPDTYYQRRRVPRMDSDLVEYAGELWEVGEDIRKTRVAARNAERSPWYRNSSACMNYGRACTFLPLCAGYDSPESGRWVERDQVHPELDGIEDDGRDLLTNSRIKTFQSCKRKHYFKYELGLSRPDEDEGEALYLGSLMHKALEAWWSVQQEDTHVPSQNTGAATEATPASATD